MLTSDGSRGYFFRINSKNVNLLCGVRCGFFVLEKWAIFSDVSLNWRVRAS